MNDAYLQQMLSRLDQEAAQRGRANAGLEVAGEAGAVSPPANRQGASQATSPPTTADPAQLLREKIAELSAKASRHVPGQAVTANPANAHGSPATNSAPNSGTGAPPTASPWAGQAPREESFLPAAPTSLAETGLGEMDVQGLILKFLMSRFTASGRDIAEQLHLPFSLMEPLLAQFKIDQRVVHKSSAPLTDYVYQLTAAGLEEARHHQRSSSYFGAAPVSLEAYIASVHAQSITKQHCDTQDMASVFDDLIVGAELKSQIGQAVHGGQGFFLYGAPGNGKTSIAERVARAFGRYVWIPRAIGIDGEVIRLYDPCKHVEAPLTVSENIDAAKVDRRWLRIHRPTIVVGGELTLEQLEVTVNRATGISEAPLQLKSSCGILVIDDFGRQRMSPAELLNRWIVPLDRRHDYLNLPSGKIIQVPFDQLLVFSTNLQPKDLFDEAFLRRLPYKIEVPDPTETEFRKLFQLYAQRLGVGFYAPVVEHLIDAHYRRAGRPFRACHARDLLIQVRNYCQHSKLPVAMTPHAFDVAVRNYFALLG